MKLSLTLLLLLSLLHPAASPMAQPAPVTPLAAGASSPPTAVFLQYEDGFMPVTLFQDGKSLLWYYDDTTYHFYQWYEGLKAEQSDIDASLVQAMDALAGETFTCYELPTLTRAESVSFEQICQQIYQLPTHKERYKQPVDEPLRLVINSHDDAFLADVAYSSYTVKDQQNIPAAYTDHVRRKLNVEGFFNTPVIIRELWEIDLDNDGKKEAFIFASNLVPTAEEKHSSPRAVTAKPADQDGMGYYTYMLFYSETFFNIDFQLYSNIMNYRYFQDELISTFEPPFSYQYDDQGDRQLLRMWLPDATYETERSSFMLPIISDLDHDGQYDLIIIYTSKYSAEHLPACNIYLQKDGPNFYYVGS